MRSVENPVERRVKQSDKGFVEQLSINEQVDIDDGPRWECFKFCREWRILRQQ